MIKELTSLRFLFMFMIFLHHVECFPQGGVLGVSFFFVLSGFVLTLGYKDKLLSHDITYSQFISKRLIRLFPLHWICFIAALVLEIKYTHVTIPSVPVALTNVLLLQSWIPETSYYFSFNSVSWFLSDALFFSLVYPLLLKIIIWLWSDKKRFISFLSALFIIPALLFVFTPETSRFYFFYICPVGRLTDFTLGICAALIYFTIKEQPTWIEKHRLFLTVCLYGCIPFAILVALLIPSEGLVFSLFYAPVFCLLIVLVCLKPIGEKSFFSWSPFIFLGNFVFEFYLIHGLCIKYMAYHNNFGIDMPIVIPMIFLFAASLSVLCRYVFVAPVTRWLNTQLI